MAETSDLVIRQATEQDVNEIVDLALAAYQQYAEAMGEEHWIHYREGMVKTLTNTASRETIIAVENNKIIGSVLFYPSDVDVYPGLVSDIPWPELRLLAVHPSARRKKIGLKLMEACFTRAEELGEKYLGLHTEDLMESARALYDRLGFVRAPQYDFFPVENVHVKGYVRAIRNED